MLLYWSFSYKTHKITITPTKQKNQTKNPTNTTQNKPPPTRPPPPPPPEKKKKKKKKKRKHKGNEIRKKEH